METNKRINLIELQNLFVQSAADENAPKAVRKFAAQLTLLVAHTARVDRKASNVIKMVQQLDKHIAELVGFVAKTQGDVTEKPVGTPGTPPQVPPQAAGQAAATETPSEETGEETAEDDVETLTAKLVAEAEAEAAQVTPLRKPSATEGAA